MMRVFFTFWLLIVTGSIFSQQVNKPVNSGALFDTAAELHDSAEYKKEIALLRTISRSDTNYRRTMYKLFYAYTADSNFTEARQIAEQGMKRFPEYASDWYHLLANVYDDLGDTTRSAALFDTALQVNPNDHSILYDKAIVLYNQKKFATAARYFEACLLMNPYYSAAHYFLGRCYEERGEVVKAMLCYAMHLFMTPGSARRINVINNMAAISHVKDEVRTRISHATEPEPEFDLLHEIVLSKAALDTKYKLITEVEDPITRQLQVILEKLEYTPGEKSFVMQYYVPFYKKIFEDVEYNLFVNHIFSQINIKSIADFNKKNEKAMSAFIDKCVEYFNKIQSTRILDATARDNARVFYTYQNGTFLGKGAWTVDGQETLYEGPWLFYYDNGKLKASGSFAKNNREGEWIYYYKNGVTKEISHFTKDTLEGKSESWFDNGNRSEISNYERGEYEGVVKTFYYSGLPRQEAPYTKGLKNGRLTGYSTSGDLEYMANFVNGKQEGETFTYHPNGAKKNVSFFKADEAEGKYQVFYNNGQLQEEGEAVKGKKVGTIKAYYPSGAAKEVYTAVDGENEGPYLSYHENGKISEQLQYTKGQLDKKATFFDENGKVYSEITYQKGKILAVKSYDTSGVIVSQHALNNAPGKLVFYEANHIKNNEGSFNKAGDRDGKSTYYFDGGKVSSETYFTNGTQNGASTSYYLNGVVAEKSNYSDGVLDGHYAYYYLQNKTKTEGWYVNGSKQGEFVDYNAMGDVSSRGYYRNNEQDGYSTFYHPDGKKNYETFFDEGWMKKIEQYDSLGNVISHTELLKGSGNVVFKYTNGNVYLKTPYQYYNKHGRSETYFFDGVLNAIQYYKYGVNDSIARVYYHDGKIRYEGQYARGEKLGDWKFYYENGKLESVEHYKDGELDGKMVEYNEDGSLDRELGYSKGQLHGETRWYADDENLMIVFNYHKGRLMSYSYQDRNGNMVAPIPLPHESGIVKAYFRNGQLSVDVVYEGGNQNSMRRSFFTNGNVFREGERILGLQNGPQKTYFKNGQLAREETSYYNNAHGKVVSYYPNGKIRSEESYYCDELHGTCKYYNEDGQLKETRIYHYAVLENIIKP